MDRSLILLLAGLFSGLFLGYFLLTVLDVKGARQKSLWENLTGNASEQGLKIMPGSAAPDFKLQNLEGVFVQLSDWRGQAVILNFWATWCGPCRLEMPLLQKYAQDYGSQLQIVAVNDAEPFQEVQEFVSSMGLTFPILLDPQEEVVRQYQIHAYPVSYFLDASGMIRAVHIGILTEKALNKYLEQIGVSK